MVEEQNPTIYSVAKEAQVSISTVSRVLNSPYLVKKETREKVLQAIDKLGFVPKAAAQAQAQKRFGRIGVLTPFFTHPSFMHRMRGISSVLAAQSYELVIYPVESREQIYYFLETLPVTRRLDGLITMALAVNDGIANRYTSNRFPLVCVEFKHNTFSSVMVDNFAGGKMAADYFIRKGLTTFGFIGDGDLPEYSLRPSEQRLQGYQQELEKHGIHLLEDLIIFPSKEQVSAQTKELLNHPQRPSAIFAGSDEIAMQVLSLARKAGLSIPQDLAVIGFDDLDFANYIGLTTISQQLDKSGKIAAELLLNQFEGKPKQEIELELSIIERDTA